VHRALLGLLQFDFISQQIALSSYFTSRIHFGRTGFCWVSCRGLLEGGLAAQRGPARAVVASAREKGLLSACARASKFVRAGEGV
jgi:hypothetical protein